MLVNPIGSTAAAHLAEIEESATAQGQKLIVSHLSNGEEVNSVFKDIAAAKSGALIVTADPFFFALRKRIVQRVDELGIPAIYYTRETGDS